MRGGELGGGGAARARTDAERRMACEALLHEAGEERAHAAEGAVRASEAERHLLARVRRAPGADLTSVAFQLLTPDESP